MQDSKGNDIHFNDTLFKKINGEYVYVRVIKREIKQYGYYHVELIPESSEDDIGMGKGMPYRLESPDELLQWTKQPRLLREFELIDRRMKNKKI